MQEAVYVFRQLPRKSIFKNPPNNAIMITSFEYSGIVKIGTKGRKNRVAKGGIPTAITIASTAESVRNRPSHGTFACGLLESSPE